MISGAIRNHVCMSDTTCAIQLRIFCGKARNTSSVSHTASRVLTRGADKQCLRYFVYATIICILPRETIKMHTHSLLVEPYVISQNVRESQGSEEKITDLFRILVVYSRRAKFHRPKKCCFRITMSKWDGVSPKTTRLICFSSNHKKLHIFCAFPF